jgi:hypothetical protein
MDIANSLPTAGLATPAGSSARTPEARLKSGQAFEALVAGQLAGAMLETVEADGSADAGAQSDIWRGVLSEAIGRDIARSHGLGLAARVAAELAHADGAK